jgi:hypothetical protein
MGYISLFEKDGVVFYTAEHPSILERKLEENKERTEKLIPELLSIANIITKKPKVRFYE